MRNRMNYLFATIGGLAVIGGAILSKSPTQRSAVLVAGPGHEYFGGARAEQQDRRPGAGSPHRGALNFLFRFSLLISLFQPCRRDTGL
jgi:hypothetical protein